jgi:hypothetical protein
MKVHIKKLIILIIIMMLILLIIFWSLGVFKSDNSNRSIEKSIKCSYKSDTKEYIKKTPECVINFLCEDGTRAFRDECGCGCEKEKQLIGGTRDENGCLVPAGYSWNDTLRVCVREWSNESDKYQVTNFEQCQQAGYPVLDSQPFECIALNGESFFAEG